MSASKKIIGKSLASKFNKVVGQAKRAIFVERAWPKLVPTLCAGGLFLSASWMGLWGHLSPEARMYTVLPVIIAAAALPLIVKSGRLRISEKEALRRMDDNLGEPSRPAQMLRDHISQHSSGDSKRLWDIHTTEIWNKWGNKFEAGAIKSQMPKRDRFNLRYGVLALTLAAAAFTPHDRVTSVTDAFNWSTPPAPVIIEPPIEFKAWVSPPEYINDARTHYLSENKNDEGAALLSIDEHSVLTILVFGDNPVTVNNERVAAKNTMTTVHNGKERTTWRYEIPFSKEGAVNVKISDGPSWHFSVEDDTPPSVKINDISIDKDNPESLKITYETEDDHGIESGEVHIRIPEEKGSKKKPLPSTKIPPIPLP